MEHGWSMGIAMHPPLDFDTVTDLAGMPLQLAPHIAYAMLPNDINNTTINHHTLTSVTVRTISGPQSYKE